MFILRCNGFFTDRSFEQPAQHWYNTHFTQPSVGPYAHPMSFIDVGKTIGGHLVGGFQLLEAHDRERQVVLQP